MDIFKIDGISYNVTIASIKEKFNILYTDQTGRTIADGAPMILDPIGTFFGHVVTVKRKKGYEAQFDLLYRVLTRPRGNGMLFSIVHFQDVLDYEGYVSNGERGVKKIDPSTGKIYWDELTINIVPTKAQVIANAEDSMW